LATLGFVAAWRVVLMIRVANVLMEYGPWASVFLVMIFANAVALIALAFLPVHIFQTMGGIRLTESERVLRSVAFAVGNCGGWLMPVWLLGGFLLWRSSEPQWQVPLLGRRQPTGSGIGLWALAIASVAGWFLVMPWTQAEQSLRWRVEHDLRPDR